MATETKKSWDKPPVSKKEWAANQAAIAEACSEGAPELRSMFKKGLADLSGWQVTDQLEFSVNMARTLVKHGYLKKPDWNDRSTLTLEHFLVDELAEAYNKLKAVRNTVDPMLDPDTCPF